MILQVKNVLQLQCNFNTKILNIGCYILNIFKNHDQQSNVNKQIVIVMYNFAY